MGDIKIMDFHHLDTPQSAADGTWVVLATNDMFLVLLKNATLAYGPDYKPTDYQFPNEIEAHHAAASYYSDNKRMAYPYVDRLLELSGSLVFGAADKIQSTPMDFK